MTKWTGRFRVADIQHLMTPIIWAQKAYPLACEKQLT